MNQSEIQTTRSLADQAKNNGDFSKAIQYYESLFDATKSDVYYYELIKLYPEIGDFKTAEKIIKRRVKKYSQRPDYLVDLGHIYEVQKNNKEANKYYNEAISKGGNIDIARSIANQFLKYDLNEYAEQLYLMVRKKNKNPNLFRFELARAYMQQGKTSEMVDEYLAILGNNRGHLRSIQNIFQRILHPDPEGIQMQMLKNKLLRKIQNQPQIEVFPELLIWLYIQDKNFDGAFIQAKALDRRAKEGGERLNSLANLCMTNKRYDVAKQCYQYIISLKEKNQYYHAARMNLVKVMKLDLLSKSDYNRSQLIEIRNEYLKTLEELKISARTYALQIGLADLNAFYLNDVDTAILILNRVIKLVGLNEHDRANAKISLGDLMLLKGEKWEASLLYSQVEKAFKYDQLGEIAKFKNAKIAYYVGDFYWSQAQLDVLKGSTSKLIANDAMELSLLITDNIGRDSISEPLEMFARADLLIFKMDYQAANTTLDSIPKFFPSTRLIDDILMAKFQMAYQQKQYELAKENLEKVISDFAYDVLADDALFELAKLEEEKFENPERAMDLYKTIITDYPSSLFVVESRKRFRFLRGDDIEKQEDEFFEGL